MSATDLRASAAATATDLRTSTAATATDLRTSATATATGAAAPGPRIGLNGLVLNRRTG